MNKNEVLLERLEREDIQLASFFKRLVAFLIDIFIISCLIVAILYVRISGAPTQEVAMQIVQGYIWQMFFIQFLYHSIFCYLYGASLGKMAMKIKIIDGDTMDKPGLLRSLIRGFVRGISDHIFCLGFAWALSNPLLKTWHDYAAKTVVISLV